MIAASSPASQLASSDAMLARRSRAGSSFWPTRSPNPQRTVQHPRPRPGADPAGARCRGDEFRLARAARLSSSRMRRGDPRDPLLLQVLPIAAERDRDRRATRPIRSATWRSRAGRGLLHKYEGRALLVATGACAVHCRYCFRRHFPYGEESALQDGWAAALEQLRADTSISEVILSGGDPLSLSDRRLRQLTDALRAVPHIRRLRIHTRYPVVLPGTHRCGLLDWLSDAAAAEGRRHPRQPRQRNRRAVAARLPRARAAAGVTLLNQSVLLAGVNDSVDALAELSEALFDDAGPALLPAPARSGAGCGALRCRGATRTPAARSNSPQGCRAISCRDWCAKCPARRRRRLSCLSDRGLLIEPGDAATIRRTCAACNDLELEELSLAEQSAVPMIVLTRHQDNVEAINSTLRNAGHAVRCNWIRELNDLGDALAQINAHMLVAFVGPDAGRHRQGHGRLQAVRRRRAGADRARPGRRRDHRRGHAAGRTRCRDAEAIRCDCRRSSRASWKRIARRAR